MRCLIEAVQQFQARVPALREELRLLKDGDRGANWSYKTSRPLRDPLMGLGGVVNAVGNLIRTGGVITAGRLATKEEQDAAEAREGKKLPTQYIEEPVATVAGLGFFAPDLDLRRLIVEDIDAMLEKIEPLDVQQATPREIAAAAKWAGQYEGRIRAVRRAIELAQVLLTKANLAPLTRYAELPDASKKMAAYLRTLP